MKTMSIAISVKNLGKKYQIGVAETKFRYNMLRDVLVDTIYAPMRLAKAILGNIVYLDHALEY